MDNAELAHLPTHRLAELIAAKEVSPVDSDMEGAAQRVKVYSDVGRDVTSYQRNLVGADTLQSAVTRESHAGGGVPESDPGERRRRVGAP